MPGQVAFPRKRFVAIRDVACKVSFHAGVLAGDRCLAITPLLEDELL